MLSPHLSRLLRPHVQAPLVMVQFGDGAHSFVLQSGTTFAELADRIDKLASMHEDAPVAIQLEFGTTRSRFSPATDLRTPTYN